MSRSLRAALSIAAVIVLTCHCAQRAEVSCQRIRNGRRVSENKLVTKLPLYVFHGAVDTRQGALQNLIVHILLKAVRRQSDGTFLARAVLYTERNTLQEDEEFVPVPRQLDLYFEYRSTSTDTWGRIHFRSLETLQPQGPFIHQAEVPADIAARELHLTMSDWPQYYTLHLKTIIDTDANVNSQIHTESYKSAVVISDVHSVNATVAARLLATHMAHHMAIGFDVYLLYTRGAELSQALHQNSVTARYLQQGQLSLVSIDSLQIPQYGLEGWAEWAAYDPTKLISYNHAALLLWGKKFRLAVLDIDELLSTNTPGSTVSSWFDRCYPNADIISASRVEVVCSACQAQGLSELGFFEQAWDPYNPTDILRNFSTITSFNLDPKSVFDSNKVAQVWLHRPATLPGSTAIDVVSRSESDLAENCVCVVHLLNLFKDRIHNTSDQAAASRFQWQVQRHRSPAHGIEHI